jgi:hypothetical protein
MRPILPLLAAIAITAALSGCNSQTVSKADASALSASFCGTWIPAVYPVIGNFNAQIRADYNTAATACLAINEGKSVNAVTVAIAALAVYEGVSATYPKLTALSDHDLATARRIAIDIGVR